MSLIRRLGNKSKMLPSLCSYFPDNIVTFIDLFMGSGAVSFAMLDRAKYVIANDNDEDIFNVFLAVKEHPDELLDAILTMPIHESLFNHWKTHHETECVWRAARFLMLSNFGLYGKPDTLNFGQSNKKEILFANIHAMLEKVSTVQFMSCDFRDVLGKTAGRHERDLKQWFVYSDPPYLETTNNFSSSFTAQDTQELFELLVKSGLRFAVSEFDHPVVMECAARHGLYVTNLGERQNLKNRRTELLITTYQTFPRQPTLF